MSKKHFNDLAARLLAMRPVDSDNNNEFQMGRIHQWREMVRELGQFCIAHNPNFNLDMFLRAAGYKES